jgi:type VI secretion system secreted protein VgrG
MAGDRDQEFFFTWDGAEEGWEHLRVISFSGYEALSEPYWFEIELHRHADAPDVNVADLIGSAAALKLETRTQPAWRIIHGVISSAVELGDVDRGGRYRVVLKPPFVRDTIAILSWIHLDKTIRAIVTDTVQRAAGAAMKEAGGVIAPVGDKLAPYTEPSMTFEWRVLDTERLDDPEARPYCVQYQEPDWAFVSRLLEEDGIAYHFEHGEGECRVVFSDSDSSRVKMEGGPVGPNILGREIPVWRAGGRLRPRSVALNDYNWRKPQMSLFAESRSGSTDFVTTEYPGRYEASADTGTMLANAREERFDTERRYSSAEGRCRMLGAGSIFELDHPKDKFNGSYIVTAIHHEGRERGWFVDSPDDFQPYRQQFECLPSPSAFRPARITPRPRIFGTQTAVVTAEPGSDAEINVGGPANIGCVRVRFQWDLLLSMRQGEPTSCWIRVSQFFAGRSHGAMWHPRVGDEVIVEFLHGDPDRPIVTGRVYNGTNVSPEDATARPTYSAIHSLTSPYDGNYNKMSFEDLQGEELIHIHAARDMTIDIERNYTRNTKAHDAENAGSQSISVGSTQTIDVGTKQTITTGANQEITVGADQINEISGNQSTHVGGKSGLLADVMIIERSPAIKIGGFTLVHARGGSIIFLESGGFAVLTAPSVKIGGTSEVDVVGGKVTVIGTSTDVSSTSTTTVAGPTVKVEGAVVEVDAATVNINGSGVVNVKGGSINLNC